LACSDAAASTIGSERLASYDFDARIEMAARVQMAIAVGIEVTP
jgi:hypothetical protein